MGGVGKTTMLEQLKKAAEDSKMFDWVVKVVIGEKNDPIAFQQAISEYTGEALTETTKVARAERLKRRFKEILQDGKNNILLLLDDLWEEVDLKDIGVSSSPFPNGFKLLLTSRDENVCIRMGIRRDSIFRMRVLEHSEAKLFFCEFAGLFGDGVDPELHEIGEAIVKRCGGLPIVIKTIASTLRDNIKDAWKDALFRLQNNDFEALDNIFDISYNNLKEDDKAIFLLSGLFPDDYNIPVENLLRYGWGLKLFKNVNTLATARRRINTCINNLIRSNLLIESDQEGFVKMHDLVRDFVLKNFSKVKQASIVNHDKSMSGKLTQDANESYERILLKCTGMFEFPGHFNYPNLTLLKLMDGDKQLKFPDCFYEKMHKLEVMAYEDMRTPLLIETFQYSTTLRTLSLRSCLLKGDISFLGNLINLEILSFARCVVKKLPSRIGNLRKLKLLDLTGCGSLCIDDGVFRNLNFLEELYMNTYGDRINFTEANCDELNMLSNKLFALEIKFFENYAQPKDMSFTKLERFNISIGRRSYSALILPLGNTLDLVSSRSQLLESKINELFKKTEKLLLQVTDMIHLEDISIDSQNSFSNLRELIVEDCTNLKYLFTNQVASGLTKLERLTVSGCCVLESLIHGEGENGGVIKFQELKFLSLYELPNLVSWCDIGTIVELPQLEELKFESLPNINGIFPENNISTMQSFWIKEVKIPKLEKLNISSMEKLKHIWSCDDEVNNVSMLREIEVKGCYSLLNIFPCNPLGSVSEIEQIGSSSLRRIEVQGCNILVNLFSSNPFPLLSHLEELKVKRCPSVRVLFNIELGRVGDIEQINSSLRRIEVEELGDLREVWRIKDADIRSFQALESIKIRDCKRFRNIFTPTTTKFDMGAIVDISIHGSIKYGATNDLVKNNQDHEINILSNAAFPSYLIHTFRHLCKLHLESYLGTAEVVFEIDQSPSRSRELATVHNTHQQPLVLLPHLEELSLYDMEAITHVWKCNWNEFLKFQKQVPDSSFYNLKTINVYLCNNIKYLFSPLMGKLLFNLKKVTVRYSSAIEEIVSNRDDKDEETIASTSNDTRIPVFPRLDTLVLLSLTNLKRIGGCGHTTTNVTSEPVKFSQDDVVAWSLCQYSRGIHIHDCHAMSSVVPSYALEKLQNLESLEISKCDLITEVFETEKINNNGVVGGGIYTILTIPRLRNINVPQLSNLRKLKITKCEPLQHVFTFSTLESLMKLEELQIKYCKGMKVIVKEENGEQTTSSKVVVFPSLKSIKLIDLPNLRGFFLGMNDFRWPLLKDVIIEKCPEMEVFTSGESTSPKLKYIYTHSRKYSPAFGLNFQATTTLHQTPCPSLDGSHASSIGVPWSFSNLAEMDVKYNYYGKYLIPSNEVQHLHKLEKIHAEDCDYLEEIFEVATEGTVVKLSNLREILLKSLQNIKYIWNNNQFEFPNLTRLVIDHCNRLKHVFTISMVGSLLKLKELDISSYHDMEVIVKEEEESHAIVKEIVLPCLKSLRLYRLITLKGFFLGKEAFQWPSLDTLEIKDCRK